MIKVRDLMRTEVVTVREDMTVRELAAFLADEGISGAPVTSSSGEVVGVVSAKDILTAAAEGVPLYDDEVDFVDQEWFDEMSYVDAKTPAVEVDWDLVWPTSKGLDERTVGAIMSRTKLGVAPSTSVADLAKYMTERAIHRSLVMVDERLVGIVTTYDVLQAVANGKLVARA